MDIVTWVRVCATVLSFLVFLGIVWWTLDKHKSKRFEEASRLPFLDE